MASRVLWSFFMASTNSGATLVNTSGPIPTPIHTVLMNQDVSSMLFPTTNFSHQIAWKLDDKNFLLWRQEIEPAIIALGLNHFVASPHSSAIPFWWRSQSWLRQSSFLNVAETRSVSPCLASVYAFELNACLSSWIETLVSGMGQNSRVFSSPDANKGTTTLIRAPSHDAGLPSSFRFPLLDKSAYWCACVSRWCCYLSRAYGFDSGQTS